MKLEELAGEPAMCAIVLVRVAGRVFELEQLTLSELLVGECLARLLGIRGPIAELRRMKLAAGLLAAALTWYQARGIES